MVKIKNAQRLDGMDQSGVRKLFTLAQNVTGIISLGIGQPNIPTPKGLIDILLKLIKNGDNYYSPTQGTKKFLEAIAEQNKHEYNLEYNPTNEILATASGCEALYATLMSYINPGDEVLLPNPCFLTYYKQVKLAGGNPIWLKPTEDLKINTSNLQEYVNKKTKAIILNFPSNPT